MALVTVADLRKYMSDISLSANQQAVAQRVLDGTQQMLELHLGRPVQPVQVREKRRSDSMGDVALSVTPVYKVISLRRMGTADAVIPSRDLVPLSEDEVNRVWDAMPETNIAVPGGIHVGQTFRWYVVEYIGGYNGYVDDALKLAILEVASRTMTVNHDDVLTIKDDIAREPANASSLQKGWTIDELTMFDRIRRRTVYR
jgi:hypothetical protein